MTVLASQALKPYPVINPTQDTYFIVLLSLTTSSLVLL